MPESNSQRVHRILRRRMLQVGALGPLGLSLPQLLQAETTDPFRDTISGSPRSCIFILLNGGPSQLDTFDPKPDAPAEIRGQYKAIRTQAPGLLLSEKLPGLAAVADRFTMVRTYSHDAIDHPAATHLWLSGQSNGARDDNSPYFGSIAASLRPARPEVPSYVWLHNLLIGTRKTGKNESGGKLGPAFAPLRVGADLHNPSVEDFRVRAFDPPPGLTTAQVRDRHQLLTQLEQAGPAAGTADSSLRRMQRQAVELITSPNARAAFDLAREPAKQRDRYGRHQLGQYCLMARRLIESGVRLVSVTGCTGAPPGDPDAPIRQVWDMHDTYYEGTDNMYGVGLYGLGITLPRLDQAVSTLLTDLDERGLLEQTLVVIGGEFGRTPKFEGKGRGRGHWPHCFSGIMAGAGVKRGFVYGRSDKIAGQVADGRPISADDFGATVLHALGIAPEARPNPHDLGQRASLGEPVLEIFA